jgi:hypothetical protein
MHFSVRESMFSDPTHLTPISVPSIRDKAVGHRTRTDEGQESVARICEVIERLYETLGCQSMISDGSTNDPLGALLSEDSPKASFSLVRPSVSHF